MRKFVQSGHPGAEKSSLEKAERPSSLKCGKMSMSKHGWQVCPEARDQCYNPENNFVVTFGGYIRWSF
jgi:hypothetical protein